MTTITSFDKTVLKELRRSMQEALDRMDIDGLSIEVGNMRFDSNTVTIKVTAKTAGADVERTDLLVEAMLRHGVKDSQAGGHQLVDYHPKKRKYPFIMSGPQGGRYRISPEQARRRFGSTREAA